MPGRDCPTTPDRPSTSVFSPGGAFYRAPDRRVSDITAGAMSARFVYSFQWVGTSVTVPELPGGGRELEAALPDEPRPRASEDHWSIPRHAPTSHEERGLPQRQGPERLKLLALSAEVQSHWNAEFDHCSWAFHGKRAGLLAQVVPGRCLPAGGRRVGDRAPLRSRRRVVTTRA